MMLEDSACPDAESRGRGKIQREWIGVVDVNSDSPSRVIFVGNTSIRADEKEIFFQLGPIIA